MKAAVVAETAVGQVVARCAMRKSHALAAPAIGLALALIAVHRYVDTLPFQQATVLAPLDSLFALALTAGLLLLAWALGRRLLSIAAITLPNALEQALYAIACGLAVIAYATFGMAEARLLYAPVMLGLAAALAFALRRELRLSLLQIRGGLAVAARLRSGEDRLATGVVAFSVVVVMMALTTALLPPFTNDALIYHLAVPKLFVAQHRFVVVHVPMQAGFPFATEMLYTLDLLFGSDTAPALLHLTFGIMTALAVWSMANRWLGRRCAWLAVAAFLGESEFAQWAPIADIDMALTFFEFLALGAVLDWLRSRDPKLLVLGAALAGVAMGVKYTALEMLLLLALHVCTADGMQRRWLRANIGRAVLLVGIGLLVAAPWYVKNLIAYHDPLYPLLASSAPVLVTSTATRQPVARPATFNLLSIVRLPVQLITTGSSQAIAGRSLGDYVQLPLQVFLKGDTEMYGRPSLLLLFVPGSFWAWRSPIVRRLALTVFALSIIWSLGLQELRYLLPAFPGYAILAGHVADRLTTRNARRRALRVAATFAVAGAFSFGLAESTLFVAARNPFPVLAGIESRASFLMRTANAYGSSVYLNAALQPGERVLALQEWRSYYLTVPIVVEGSQDLATAFFVAPGSPTATVALLRQDRIHYIVVDERNVAKATWRAAFGRFREQYLVPVYSHEHMVVYRLLPQKDGG